LFKKSAVINLNKFTTKNVSIFDKNGNEYNTIKNNKLCYRRAPRNQEQHMDTKILYGPKVERVTEKNFKDLKKNNKLFYDRDSVVFRGPFTFQHINRGPELILKIKDLGYPQEYTFSLPVKKLKSEKLYKIL